MLVTRNITWQRVLPAPPVPAQTNNSWSTEESRSIADDEITPDRDGRGVVYEMVDELNDDLAHLNNFDVTWGFDLDAFLEEHRQQVPAAADAGNGKPETISSSQGGAVNASSALAGRVESETSGSPQGGEVDASPVPAGRAESDLSAGSTSDTDQRNSEDPHRSFREE